MAVDARHAAWQTTTGFAVRLLAESGAEWDLASGLPDLPAATDVAFEWLNREDPGREGKVRLVIVRVDDAGAETVWMYPPPARSPGQELISVFGFNPATWRPQSPDRPPKKEIRRRLPAGRPSVSGAPAVPDVVRGSSVEHTRRAQPEPEEAVPVPGPRDWAALRRGAASAMRASWDDHLSRVLLVVGLFATWFSVALLEPTLLVLSLAMLAALWARQRRQGRPDPDDDL